jgi:hypothetical protein
MAAWRTGLVGDAMSKKFAGYVVMLLMVAVLAKAQVRTAAPPPVRIANGNVSTGFDPNIHGFRFRNDFLNDAVPVADIRTGGLCGGMSYTALDYYFSHMAVPIQDYRPANRTTLQSYIYNREVDSLTSNLDKWAEVGFNPGGSRNGEFFNWGLQGTNGGRLEELRSFLDRRVPVAIDLQADGNTGNHQVVAIGYNLGRYKGDLKDFKEELKIFVYDPNYPRSVRTLIPDVAAQLYHYQEGGAERWRTYFVDKKYQVKAPPPPSNPSYPNDGAIHELLMAFTTGNDDLRGGSEINLTMDLADGTQQLYKNINLGARWLPNYMETARIVLSRPVRPQDIRNIVVAGNFSGGMGGDNWDMQSLDVRQWAGTTSNSLKTIGFNRFSGDHKQLMIAMTAAPPAMNGQVTELVFEIRTGTDDLRGGNDNLNVETLFSDGKSQRNDNVNQSANWSINSNHVVKIALSRPVAVNQIRGVNLITTFSGGMSGDNWNMDSVRVTATGPGVNKVIATHGFNHFSGSSKQLNILAP